MYFMTRMEKLICITCPQGCTLTVSVDGKSVLNVEGNQCKRGLKYVEMEVIDPRRTVTTTVRVKGGIHPLVPVYTKSPIPRKYIFDLLSQLKKIELEAPVKMGQTVLQDAFGTGIDVVASRDLPRA